MATSSLPIPQKQELYDDVTKLISDVADANAAFHKISRLLNAVRNSARSLKPGSQFSFSSDMDDLIDSWEGYHQGFTKLCRDSRTVAGDAKHVLKEVYKIIIPCLEDPDVSITEKKNELDILKSDLDRERTKADNIAESFNELSLFINAFREEEWPKLIQDHQLLVDHVFEQRVKEMEGTFDLQIAALNVVGAGLHALGNGVKMILGSLCPSFGDAIQAASANVVKTAEGYRTTRRQNFEKQVRQQPPPESALQQELVEANGLIEKILGSLYPIIAIWRAISADIYELESLIDGIRPNRGTFSLKRRFEDMKILYATLSDVLERYEIAPGWKFQGGA